MDTLVGHDIKLPALKRRKKNKANATIVVGIDFGTTFSGLAWNAADKADKTEILTNWDSLMSFNSDRQKVPSTIRYTSNGNPTEWGYGIAPIDETLQWFKLLLLDEKDLPASVRKSSHLQDCRDSMEKLGKSPTEVIADYLGLLWEHAQENMVRSIGEALLDKAEFRIVATMPAIWPFYAQQRMREAAEMAGILRARRSSVPTLSFISEPEAAALATIEDMSDRSDVKTRDHFVVCDAGGGTVDLITYTITSLKPMTVRESVKGEGQLCGAISLDQGFFQLMKELIPPNVWNNLSDADFCRIMHDHWENGIKMNFRNTEREWEIDLPFGATMGDRCHRPVVQVNRAHIHSIFQPVVDRITNLVSRQVTQVNVSFGVLVLVGGFGKSGYLHDCMKQKFGKDIAVLQGSGERPWTAVCRGAVIRGLAESKPGQGAAMAVSSRISRASYGTLVNVLPFEPDDHDVADRVWCDVQQEFLAVEQTEWFVKIGDQMKTGESISASLAGHNVPKREHRS